MSAKTSIEWCDHTFNPFWGCTKVSPGCDHCYAESWAKRFGVKWGSGEARKHASERTWAEPIRWNERAGKDRTRKRVFCASMADVFDNEAPTGTRERLWSLIGATPHLDWLLLTKRVGNIMGMVPDHWQKRFPRNVWIGATVVNQIESDRDIPKLLKIPAPIRFLSCEPLLGPIDLEYPKTIWPDGPQMCCDGHDCGCMGKPADPPLIWGIKWVIAGPESGRNARACDLAWIRSLRDQCNAWRVPFFFKQIVQDGIKIPTPELDGKRWVEMPG